MLCTQSLEEWELSSLEAMHWQKPHRCGAHLSDPPFCAHLHSNSCKPIFSRVLVCFSLYFSKLVYIHFAEWQSGSKLPGYWLQPTQPAYHLQDRQRSAKGREGCEEASDT